MHLILLLHTVSLLVTRSPVLDSCLLKDVLKSVIIRLRDGSLRLVLLLMPLPPTSSHVINFIVGDRVLILLLAQEHSLLILVGGRQVLLPVLELILLERFEVLLLLLAHDRANPRSMRDQLLRIS